MSMPAVVSSTALSSALWCAVLFLDPRRWLATLLALVGITMSIITAVLPIWIVKSLSKPPPNIPPSHRPLQPLRAQRTLRKRPSPLSVRPSTAPTPVQRRSIRIADSDPRPTLISGSSPKFYSFSSILASSAASTPSSSANSSPSPSSPLISSQLPAQSEITQVSPEPLPVSVPVPELVLFPSSSLPLSPPASSYDARVLQSLSCLDLATLPSSTDRASSPCPKRPFLLSRLGFGKRRSTTDLKTCKELVANAALSKSTKRESDLSSEAWQENPASSTTHGSTVSNPTPPTRNLLPPCPASRRRFSIFGRDCPILKDNEKIPPIPVSDLIPSAPPSSQPDVSASHSNAIAGPSVSPSPSPPLLLSSLPSLVPTQTPPMRPTRTDPYKTYGVPVPGSERARAFFKAEKAMRAERLKRTRSERSGGESDDALADRDRLGRSKEPVADVVVEQAHAAELEGQIDEFGVLSTPEKGRSKRRPRSWVLPRRGSDVPQVQRPQTSRNTTLPAKPPSKLRESFGLLDAKGASAKERGYVSDTGVPSLTYKLM